MARRKKYKVRIRAYRRNPSLVTPLDEPVLPPKKRGKKRQKPKTFWQAITPKERSLIKRERYKQRAKRLRPFFKDKFSADAGFDLRSPNSWTKSQKAKVNRYYKVMAPHITGDFVVKRYRKPSSIRAVVDVSGQEQYLPGQTAVAFRIDPGEKPESIDVKIDRKTGKARLKRRGIGRIKLLFDKDLMFGNVEKGIDPDPKAEIQRVLDATNAQVFRTITGASEQNLVLTRDDVIREIVSLLEKYAPSVVTGYQRPAEEFVLGLYAYEGPKRKTETALGKLVREHKKVMVERRQAHLDVLAKKTRRARLTRRQRLKGR